MNLFLYLLVVLIWGTTWIAIVLQQGTVPVAVSIFWRFALASALLWLILWGSRRLKPLSLRDHGFCLLQGCCVFGFNFYCFYTASHSINSGLESVIFSMAVLFNAINARLFFGQRIPGRFWPAAGLGLLGMICLFWPELREWHPALLPGVGLSLLGTYGFSLGNMLSARHQRQGLDILSTNARAMLYGTGVMGALAWAQGADFTPELSLTYLGALGYLAVFGSVIAFGAYFALVGRIGASQAAYSTLLFPLVALGCSTLFEGYVWHANAVLGLALILLGNGVMFIPSLPLGRGRRAATA